MSTRPSRQAWLFDVGSTFTKLSVVDLDDPGNVRSAQSPTTVATDVRVGMRRAIADVERAGGPAFATAELRLASSSAAGGLAMVVSGLVPKLSLEAGRIAALGAGAKLVGSWGYRLTEEDLGAVEAARPDIVLLTGGTDGGDRDAIRHNAAALAGWSGCPTVIVAGNREVSAEVRGQLSAAGVDARVAPNIMPELGQLAVEPVREVIREVFLEEIVKAKGIDKARALVDRDILPTPGIVLGAVGLIAEDVFGEATVAVEVGGATTNVHSYSAGEPRERHTVRRGFVEPLLKRTVEGDLGVRHNARTILELAGATALASSVDGIDAESASRYVDAVAGDPSSLPAGRAEGELDSALAAFAAHSAVGRHAGRLQEVVLPSGPVLVQYGKDLRDVGVMVFTGGPVINAPSPGRLIERVIAGQDALSLTPERPRRLLDRRYVLYAAGLLGEAGLRAEAAELVERSLDEADAVEASAGEAHAVN